MSFCPQDRTFGPGSDCRSLDFTLLFEQSILTFGPDVAFILLASLRLYFLYSEGLKLCRLFSLHVMAKLAVLFVLVASSATSIWASLRARDANLLSLWVPAPILQLVSSLFLSFLVLAEHYCMIAPSLLVILYTLCKGLFSAAILRSYLQIGLDHSDNSLIPITGLIVGSYLSLLFFELMQKRRLLRVKTLPSVSTCSFVTRSCYFWLVPLLWHGRNKALTLEDCGDIPAALKAESAVERLERALLATPNASLLKISFKVFGWEFMAPVIPRIILLLVTFAQPLLVNQILSFIVNPLRPAEQGWALLGGFICVYVVMTVSNSLYWEQAFNATVVFRGALVGNIYRKALRLSSAKSRTLNGGTATTYISSDVGRIAQAMELVHELWSALVSIGLAIALLYSQATWPAFMPIPVTFLLLIFAGVVGIRTALRQKEWLEATANRVKFMTSVVGVFLPIKWSNYEDIIAQRLNEMREREMNMAGSFYLALSLAGALSFGATALCILGVLGTYTAIASRHGALDVTRLFTIVSTVNLLAPSLGILGQYAPFMFAAYTSIQRLDEFFKYDERQDLVTPRDEDDTNSQEKGNESKAEEDNAIVMSSASFSWAPDTDTYLKDVSIVLDKPQLYMCVGSVASGKSLLLLSILGETTLKSGQYQVPQARIAYASQDALIIPGTIRENILFGMPFETERYNRVLEACALIPDLKQLKAGDGTLLGEKGIRLSGGQKQRVGLARAIYADAPWTLLDDPLSALDAETEAHVFRSLFGASSLTKGKSVLLVTHNVHLLSHAAEVLVLESGKIQYQGTLEEISKQGYDVTAKLRAEHKPSKEEVSSEQKAEHISEVEPEEPPIAETSKGFVPYKFYCQMAQWKHVYCGLFAITLTGAMELGIQGYLKAWSASGGKNQGAWVAGYGGFNVANLLVNAIAFFVFIYFVALYSGLSIHREELKGLFGTAPAYFMTTPAARIVNRFSQDIFTVDFEFPFASITFVISIIILLGGLVFIFIAAPWLTLSVIPFSVIYYFTLIFYTRTSKQLQHLEAASMSPLYTVFSSTITGLETIRGLHVGSFFRKQNDALLDRSQRPFFFRFAGQAFLKTELNAIASVLAIGLAALSVGLRGSVNASFLGLALSNLTNLTTFLNAVLIALAMVENGSVSVSRIHEVVTLPPEPETGAPLPDEQAKSWPSKGSVEFDDVKLRYSSRPRYITSSLLICSSFRDDHEPALRGVSCQIPPGSKVGICGRSGSGKSSLIMALLRGIDPSLTSGSIKIDGIDISTVLVSELRRSLSLVAQDPFLWRESLRDNLDPERQVEEKDLWEVLRQVEMFDVISELPEKLDTILEDGGSFSKGQRQLLCLARVLLRKRKIVILDEASSSLDHDTDEKIRKIIRSELIDCTVIAVAHRLATIIDYDLILVMDQGVIVESGPPQVLLQNSTSRFSLLASTQGLHPDGGATHDANQDVQDIL